MLQLDGIRSLRGIDSKNSRGTRDRFRINLFVQNSLSLARARARYLIPLWRFEEIWDIVVSTSPWRAELESAKGRASFSSSPGLERRAEKSSPLETHLCRKGAVQLIKFDTSRSRNIEKGLAIYPGNICLACTPLRRPLRRTRDILPPPGSGDSLISLRTHAYG